MFVTTRKLLMVALGFVCACTQSAQAQMTSYGSCEVVGHNLNGWANDYVARRVGAKYFCAETGARTWNYKGQEILSQVAAANDCHAKGFYTGVDIAFFNAAVTNAHCGGGKPHYFLDPINPQ